MVCVFSTQTGETSTHRHRRVLASGDGKHAVDATKGGAADGAEASWIQIGQARPDQGDVDC